MAPSPDSEIVSFHKCVPRSKIGCKTVQVKADSEVAVLGLTFDTLPPGLVVVGEVLPDCWAELSGLEAGDVVTVIQGRSVLNLPQDEFVCMMQERPLALSVSRPTEEANQSTQGDEFPAAAGLSHSTILSLGQRRPAGASYGPFHQPLKCKLRRPTARLALGRMRPGGAPFGPLHQSLNCTAGRSDLQVANRNSVPLRAVGEKAICGSAPSGTCTSPSNSLLPLPELVAETIH